MHRQSTSVSRRSRTSCRQYVLLHPHITAYTHISFAQLINELGFSPLSSQGLTVAPYAVGWFLVFFQAWHSDRTRDRGYHIMLSTAISCVGYIVLAALAGKGISSRMIGGRYFALFLVVGGNYSLFPLVM